MTIRNITDAEEILKSFVPNARKYYKDGLSLDRMWPMLELADNPHKKLKVIHVAGTSGKTSTSYYIAALLKASGKKTGLTVSPHVDSLTERVQINGDPLSEDVFCADLNEFLELIAEVEAPSYFELLMVFILWEFVRYDVDYAVLETGLGGLLDSTNVVTREDKVCVITDIGFDHMQMLGNTIEEIASQKAGIIHECNQVFMHKQGDTIMQVVASYAHTKNAQVKVIEKGFVHPELPLYQDRNFALAKRTVEFVAIRDGFSILKDFDPSQVLIPGRMELVITSDNKALLFDGAHNEQKMTAFAESFKSRYPNEKATILLAMKEGKEYKDVIRQLVPIANKILITAFSDMSQDLQTTAQNPEEIADYAHTKHPNVVVIKDQNKALQELLASETDHRIVTGSLYLLGQIRKLLVYYNHKK